MAYHVYLNLQLDGKKVEGENTSPDADLEGLIECYQWGYSVSRAIEPGTGNASSDKQHKFVHFRKKIEKTSPLFFKMLCEAQSATATFSFYRVGRGGAGKEQYYTVTLTGAKVTEIEQVSPDTLLTKGEAAEAYEHVHLAFNAIKWEFASSAGKVAHEDVCYKGAAKG